MVFQYWHLAIPVALGALVVWGLRVARQATLLALAAALLAVSGFLLYTLVLEETNLQHDLNSQVEDAALIGVPAVLGLTFGVIALKRIMGRRAGTS